MAAQPLIIISKPPEMTGRKAMGPNVNSVPDFFGRKAGKSGGAREGREAVPLTLSRSDDGSPAAGYFASEHFTQRKEDMNEYLEKLMQTRLCGISVSDTVSEPDECFRVCGGDRGHRL